MSQVFDFADGVVVKPQHTEIVDSHEIVDAGYGLEAYVQSCGLRRYNRLVEVHNRVPMQRADK